MKIAIVTLPLHTNYGGLLQAYALKTVLEGLGHEAVVLDRKDKMPLPTWWKAPAVYFKRSMLRLVRGADAPEVFRELRARREFPTISSNVRGFVEDNISPLEVKSYYSIPEEFDAFVVGSDQVWRPRYFGNILNAFLDFTSGHDVIRVSYAASFGTDSLEYEYQQIEDCSSLLRKFDGISVREDSAVTILDQWFDCDRAVQVLDPVMLLDGSIYRSFASHSGKHPVDGSVAVYFLDSHENMNAVTDFVCRVLGKPLHDFSVRIKGDDGRLLPLGDRVAPGVEQWLSCISDASFVVTDSFHVCALSILLHKPFLALSNPSRGMARLDSLTRTFSLEERLIHGLDTDGDDGSWLTEISWDEVDKVLEEKRKFSIDFLKKYLNV